VRLSACGRGAGAESWLLHGAFEQAFAVAGESFFAAVLSNIDREADEIGVDAIHSGAESAKEHGPGSINQSPTKRATHLILYNAQTQ